MRAAHPVLMRAWLSGSMTLWLLFFSIAILPAFGMPNCPLMIVGGGAAAAAHGIPAATGVAVAAVVVNVLWTYWVAAYPLRSFLWQRVDRFAKARFVTRMEEGDVTRATLLLHVTPGVPLCIQTYFPGVHRMHYGRYLVIAIPVQSLYTALIVATSGAAVKVLREGVLPAVVLVAIGLLAWKLFSGRRLWADVAIED